MKKYLFTALAALGFVACENESENLGSNLSGELEQSYIAISLASAEMGTRADGAVYEDGLATENDVNSAYVFFFRNGQAFTNANTNGYNHQEIDLDEDQKDPANDNVSHITNKVLVIDSYNGELPNQMVAVLNWTPENKSYSLAELKAEVSECKTGDYFVMSNAVYKDNSGDVYATPLAYSDFKNTKGEALDAPVQIYVERVAAKVRFTTPGDLYEESLANDTKKQIFKLKASNSSNDPILVDGKELYAKVLGWELYQEGQDAYLLKNIDTNWGISEQLYGFYWNDPTFHRSYWAISKDRKDGDDTFNGLNENLPSYIYCCENTKQGEDWYTKVIVSAQLQYENGEIVPVARWFGHDYVGQTNLLTAVQNTLSNTYYSSADGKTYTSITVDDIINVEGTTLGENQYETYFQLSANGQTKCWYKRNGETMTKLTDISDPANLVQTTINSELKAIQPALFYDNGRTYYYTNIKHLVSALGVVRNHVYDVKITSIAGFGTPVLSNDHTIDTPEVPEQVKETFLAAQINILSWRLVENDYPLGK